MSGPVGGEPVLVVGGTGTVGSRVVAALRERGVPVRIGSRHDPGDPGWVRFDWTDPSTFGVARGVDRAFLTAPVGVADPRPLVEPFLARSGLARAVLLGSSLVSADEPGFGALYPLVGSLPAGTVLRPSWFLQNFLGDHHIAQGVRTGEIVSATGGGRIGFVDAGDIAAVAAHVLADERPRPGELVLTGPEALAYDDAAATLTAQTGRPVTHRSVAPAELAWLLERTGTDSAFAAFLARLDAEIATGAEDRVTPVVEHITGRPPRGFRDVVVPAYRDVTVGRRQDGRR